MPFEETNPWAAYFAKQSKEQAETRRKAAKKAQITREYKVTKSKAIVALEAKITAQNGKSESFDDRTANGLTRFILTWLEWYGYYGARVNEGGIRISEDKWRTSGSTKGVADVIACIEGHFCQFEVKAGKDRPRESQIIQQRLTIAAGGDYVFTHNADEFVQQVETIKKKIHHGKEEKQEVCAEAAEED